MLWLPDLLEKDDSIFIFKSIFLSISLHNTLCTKIKMPNSHLFRLQIVLLAFGGSHSLFTLVRAFSFAYGGLQAAYHMHDALLQKVIAAPITFFDRNPRGRILNRQVSRISNFLVLIQLDNFSKSILGQFKYFGEIGMSIQFPYI